MQTQSLAADVAMRRFKKKLTPTHVKPDSVLPCGTYGTTGITLRRVPPAYRSNMKVIDARTH